MFLKACFVSLVEVSILIMADSQKLPTTFSPSGKLLQINHALQAVGRGKTSLGICATNGVVLATEKKLPTPLIDSDEFHKIHPVTDSVGTVYMAWDRTTEFS